MKKIINFPTKKISDSHEYYKNYVDIKNKLLNKINKNELKNIIEEILTAVKKQKNIRSKYSIKKSNFFFRFFDGIFQVSLIYL